MSDFVDEFVDYFRPAVSPGLFKTWSGVSCLAAALERRVWVETPRGPVFPNLYVLLVAPPGSGKFIVEQVRNLWRSVIDPDTKIPVFKVAPKNMTKAALVDELLKAKQNKVIRGYVFPEYHSLLVAAEDFGTLVPSFDREYINTLNDVWNNPELHDEARRHGPAKDVSIHFPMLNILGGAQPNYLTTLFQEEQTWENGMSRRVIMLYSSRVRPESLLSGPKFDEDKRKGLCRRLGEYSMAYGPTEFTPEAAEFFENWYSEGSKPVPTHAKLETYKSNRELFVMKLSVVAALARGGPKERRIQVEDVKKAQSWLFSAEATMPDIFRAMAGKTDILVLQEFHYALSLKYEASGQKTVDEKWVWAFMQERTTSDKIVNILAMGEKAGWFEVDGFRRYKPKVRPNTGKEY